MPTPKILPDGQVAPADAGPKDDLPTLPPKMPEPAKYDPLDLANLRLAQNFQETAATQKLLTTVPLMKPSKQMWFRVHPSPDYRGEFALYEIKDEGEKWFVTPPMVEELGGLAFRATVYVCVSRQGTLFVTWVRLPGGNGKDNPWWQSARTYIGIGMEKWIRVEANHQASGYDVFKPEGKFADPIWPELSFQEIIRLAAKDKLIDSPDHYAVKALRGAI
jgi:hypothetical protein